MEEKLTMPKITVAFRAAASTAITRSTKGVVALIIRDAVATKTEQSYELTSTAQIPDGLGEANKAAIRRVFAGGVNPPRKVLVRVINASATITANCAALKWLATQQFDYLAGHDELSAEEAGVIKTWIATQRADHNAIYKAVLPNLAADHEAVVNFTASGIRVRDKTYTTAAYCGRIAGLLAGTPMTQSGTYARLPEVDDIERLAPADEDTAVGAGKLILTHDGIKVKLGRAVNSLTTVAAPKTGAWQKIKIVEILDMVARDIRLTIQDNYIGRAANSYDNKLQLVTAIRGYLADLAASGLIETSFTCDLDLAAQEEWLQSHVGPTGSMSVDEIRKANTGTHVWLTIYITPVDAMEDVFIHINL